MRTRSRRYSVALVAALVATTSLVTVMSAPVSAVVNGTAIPGFDLQPSGQFGWIARLDGPAGTCTGSLVSPDWVLTAAHCVPADTVLLGSDPTPIAVADSIVHPLNDGSSSFDLALVQLATPSTRTPIVLTGVSDGLAVGTSLTVAGFGATSATGDAVASPRRASMQVSSLSSSVITSTGTSNTCSGDSGGPVLSGSRLVGVTSAGDANCAELALQVRVSNNLAWIASVTGLDQPNNPPVVSSGEIDTSPGSVVSIRFEFSDPDGDPVTLVSTDLGVLELIECDGFSSPFTCTFSVPAGVIGTTFVTYTVSDGVDRTTGTWTINSLDVPVAPVADDLTFAVKADTSIQLFMSASDANGDALAYAVMSPPTHGTLIDCFENLCTYVPESGFLGLDSFTYTASDGTFTSPEATVTISVEPNRAPVAIDTTATVRSGSSATIEPFAADPDGDPITVTIVDQPVHGTLICDVTVCSYRSESGYLGPDSFTFTARDDVLSSDVATVSIDVVANMPPVTEDGSAVAKQGVSTQVALVAFDPDPDPELGSMLSFAIVDGPAHGSLTNCSFDVCDYTSDPDFSGVDTFTWTASDESATSAVATATIEVLTSSWQVTPLSIEGDAASLAQVIGNGAGTSSASFVGAPTAAGTFTGGSEAFGLDAGIALGTGELVGALGPNLLLQSSTILDGPGDPDVDRAARVSTVDAAVLEFDLVPSTDALTLRYVFASDEYQGGTVDPAFNDTAVITVDGQRCDVPGGAPSLRTIHLDTVDGGGSNNPELFIENSGVGGALRDIDMNGLSTVLECTSAVAAGVASHVKIAIADGGDPGIDSVLFVEGTVVTNSPPEVTVDPIASVAEGSAAGLVGSAVDPDADPLTFAWTSDAGATCWFSDAAAVTSSFTCSDDGSFAVTLTATDDSGATGSATATVEVSNAAPAVVITSPAEGTQVVVGSTLTVSATVADAGAADVLTCTFDWDDGSTSAVAASAGACTAPHVYGAAGPDLVTVTVTDDDAASASADVGIQVAARSARVAGGGWLRSGRDKVKIEVSANSNGGSVSVRVEGRGRDDDRGHRRGDGESRFRSTAVTSLVVAGSTATVRAAGTWDKRPGHTIEVKITDTGTGRRAAPDRVDITIRNAAGGVVFSTAGPLVEGNIAIR